MKEYQNAENAFESIAIKTDCSWRYATDSSTILRKCSSKWNCRVAVRNGPSSINRPTSDDMYIDRMLQQSSSGYFCADQSITL